ncbi:hypothetical protein [Edaphobacter aggregans]|uniref:hypothetical protein n=1 Tax=Edaphobacter aggregans TaxID=570835 RepID=UPI000556D14F|nr:hypothetical protein [Edaphobacter aggregans]
MLSLLSSTFELEIDNGAGNSTGISGANIDVQSATSLTSSQGYGLNLSGVNNNGESDWISEFTATSNNMTGLYDANNFGFIASDLNLGTGNYSLNSNGRGTMSFPWSADKRKLVYLCAQS